MALALTGGTLTTDHYDVMEFLLRICFRSRNFLARTGAMKRDGNFHAQIDRVAQAAASHASPANASPIAFRLVAKRDSANVATRRCPCAVNRVS
jgi:hypothetical protein